MVAPVAPYRESETALRGDACRTFDRWRGGFREVAAEVLVRQCFDALVPPGRRVRIGEAVDDWRLAATEQPPPSAMEHVLYLVRMRYYEVRTI